MCVPASTLPSSRPPPSELNAEVVFFAVLAPSLAGFSIANKHKIPDRLGLFYGVCVFEFMAQLVCKRERPFFNPLVRS